jgi:hypothetical protein
MVKKYKISLRGFHTTQVRNTKARGRGTPLIWVSLQQDRKGPKKLSGESVARKRQGLTKADCKMGAACLSHKSEQIQHFTFRRSAAVRLLEEATSARRLIPSPGSIEAGHPFKASRPVANASAGKVNSVTLWPFRNRKSPPYPAILPGEPGHFDQRHPNGSIKLAVTGKATFRLFRKLPARPLSF